MGAVFMNALVSLFEEAKFVPPLVPPFLMDTVGQRKAVMDLFSILCTLMSVKLVLKSIDEYWCGAVWGHHYLRRFFNENVRLVKCQNSLRSPPNTPT